MDSELFVSILFVCCNCTVVYCGFIVCFGFVYTCLRVGLCCLFSAGVEKELFKVTNLLEIFLLASCVERIC